MAQCRPPAINRLGADRARRLRLRLQQLSAVSSFEEVPKLPCVVVPDGSRARVSIDNEAALVVRVTTAGRPRHADRQMLVIEALVTTDAS